MPPPKPLFRASSISQTTRPDCFQRRFLPNTPSRYAASIPQSLPSIPKCPPSTCACAPMPEGLKIDYQRQMSGTMPPYAQHVVIRTGRDDWSSRIEDTPGGSNLAKRLKALVGKGGKYHDPSHPILITNSSLMCNSSGSPGSNQHALDLFPQNQYFSNLLDRDDVIDDFATRFLYPESQKLNRNGPRKPDDMGDAYGGHSRFGEDEKLANSENSQASEKGIVYRDHYDPMIYICGHMSRDPRCGILGPILQQEFRNQISLKSQDRVASPSAKPEVVGSKPKHPLKKILVGLCSHIGGHAFAGNVVIYFPKTYTLMGGGELSPLAGKGIWYGRVQPRHIEGILEETVKGGKIIQELWRGVHDPLREINRT